MHHKVSGLLGFAFLAGALGALPAGATSLLPQSVAQLTVGSDLVVEGHVTGIEARWHEAHRNVYTYVTVRVNEVHKGKVVQEIVLEELGGEANGVRAVTPSVPEFEVGERVVVFAYGTPHGTTRTLGFAMGKFTIQLDETTGVEMAVRPEWVDKAFNIALDGSLDKTVDPVDGTRTYARLIEEVVAYKNHLFLEGAVGGLR